MRIINLVWPLLLLATAAHAGFDEGYEAYTDGDYVLAYTEFGYAVKLMPSDSAALWNMGLMLEKGQGVAQDLKKAQELIGQAADLGLSAAQIRMGNYCQSAGDLNGAVEWYLLSAAKGDPRGMYNAANVLFADTKYKDVITAWALMTRAAEAKHRLSKKRLPIEEKKMTPFELKRASYMKNLLMKAAKPD